MTPLILFLLCVVIVGIIVDTLLTTLTVRKLRRIRPDLDWKSMELNPSMRFFWKMFGLWFGSLAQFFLALGLVLVVYIGFAAEDIYLTVVLSFYFGMQVTAIRIHIFNLKDMNKLKLKEGGKHAKRRPNKK